MKREINNFTVIMPHRSDPCFNQKKQIIEEISKSHGFLPLFPKIKYQKESDISETISRFEQSNFIIADLSYERPSCYYELGIAELLESKVVVVALYGTAIHQTTHRDKVRYYKDLEEYKNLMIEIFHIAHH